MEKMHNYSSKIEKRRLESKDTESAVAAAAELSAERTKHSAALVDLRKLAMKMGDDYQQKWMDALASAHVQGDSAPTGRTLHIKSGKPVNTFEPAGWPPAFTDFFYGDDN